MHWTLVTLIFLTGLCAGLNLTQFVLTRTVRMSGALICIGWVVQQVWWVEHGADSIELFIICDLAIILWFVSVSRVYNLSDKLIAASLPATTALGGFAWLNGGHTAASWWINWSLVAGQMFIGLPRPRRQPIDGAVSHGRLRHGDV